MHCRCAEDTVFNLSGRHCLSVFMSVSVSVFVPLSLCPSVSGRVCGWCLRLCRLGQRAAQTQPWVLVRQSENALQVC
eukprot:576440-Rhodomonas_salina.1